MDEQQKCVLEMCSRSRKPKTETLKKELNAVLLEENEVDYQDMPRISDYKICWRFQFHDFIAGSELKVLFFSKNHFSMATFGGINQACRYGDT